MAGGEGESGGQPEFAVGLLGELEIQLSGRPLLMGHARQRSVLAALAADAGRVVPVDGLIDRVWGERPPGAVRSALRTYLAHLRRALAPAAVTITRKGTGYLLTADPGSVDVHRFHRMLADARGEEDPRRALELTGEALALWRGEPLTELDTPWALSVRERLRQERAAAEADRLDLALQCGEHRAVLPELVVRAADDPMDERAAGQLMLALYRTGRQADALEHYQKTRQRLTEELGTDPAPALRELHRRILTTDPALYPEDPWPTVPASALVVPRNLPAAPRSFTGRADHLAALSAALDPGDPGAISAIGGAGGIGKTWLALTWAHRHLDRFPDGQLFTDLRGFSPAGEQTTPAVAVRGFLDAMGVDLDRIPTELDAQTALYRSLMAGRRMLIVLDNAATADQVTPLLPGSPTCTVLITSRHRLASLIDRHDARHLALDVLTPAEARALLARRIDTDRVAAEPDAVEELVELCGGHPLALSITARNAATRSAIALAEIAAELRELGMEALDHDTDPAASLPTVLSWSLRTLTDTQRTLFGLLGITPGPDTTPPAVAALTCLPDAHARKALSALEEASLVQRRPQGRYAMHDLVRAYAATTAHNTLPDDVREAALVRVMEFHLHTAFAAVRLLDPHRQFPQLGTPAADVRPHPLPDAAAATTWLQAEHATLLATQRAAVTLGRHHVVWHLAWALETFHVRQGHRRHGLATWQTALDATARVPASTTRSPDHRHLGYACSRLGLHEEAIKHLDRALDLAVHHQDIGEQATTHHALASAWERRGNDRQALDHARHALDLHHTLDRPVREADALNLAGRLAARLDELDTARDNCRAALALFRHHHNLTGEANTLDSLGFIAHRTGDHRQAIDHYHQALALFRTLGHTHGVADTLDKLGHPHAALEHHEQARAAWREALELCRKQERDTDAERMQRQLDTLHNAPTTAPASTP
ncbi:tetratricopeptide repeat protein [Amycolatopsis sp. H6(2020)]|nr:tetratricopeptide repeat protein [Amycolatopsis sp. H6(2020)]